MRSDANGNYVAWSDYENLSTTLSNVLLSAIDRLKEVEAGHMTAQDATLVLKVIVRLNQVQVPDGGEM